MAVIADEDNHESREAKRGGASGFPSCLEMNESDLTEGAATAEEEVEVVGTCVYYYLSGPHDARSRIGRSWESSRLVFSSEGS